MLLKITQIYVLGGAANKVTWASNQNIGSPCSTLMPSNREGGAKLLSWKYIFQHQLLLDILVTHFLWLVTCINWPIARNGQCTIFANHLQNYLSQFLSSENHLYSSWYFSILTHRHSAVLLIDSAWCLLVHIDFYWSWLMLIDSNWCWLTTIDNNIC